MYLLVCVHIQCTPSYAKHSIGCNYYYGMCCVIIMYCDYVFFVHAIEHRIERESIKTRSLYYYHHHFCFRLSLSLMLFLCTSFVRSRRGCCDDDAVVVALDFHLCFICLLRNSKCKRFKLHWATFGRSILNLLQNVQQSFLFGCDAVAHSSQIMNKTTTVKKECDGTYNFSFAIQNCSTVSVYICVHLSFYLLF